MLCQCTSMISYSRSFKSNARFAYGLHLPDQKVGSIADIKQIRISRMTSGTVSISHGLEIQAITFIM